MPIITTEPMETTLIPNTTMNKKYVDGIFKVYEIIPNSGYVLHDRQNDIFDNYDDDGNGIGEPAVMLFGLGGCTVRYDYDFTTITAGTITDIDGNEIAVNKVGPYELFAIPQSLIPADQIYGGGDNNDHEVM